MMDWIGLEVCKSKVIKPWWMWYAGMLVFCSRPAAVMPASLHSEESEQPAVGGWRGGERRAEQSGGEGSEWLEGGGTAGNLPGIREYI